VETKLDERLLHGVSVLLFRVPLSTKSFKI
jgi:hypothetical protein